MYLFKCHCGNTLKCQDIYSSFPAFQLVIFLQIKASSDGDEEDDDDDDDDDDFDEVPEKEGYEPHIPEYLRAEYGKSSFTKRRAHTSHLQTHA